MNQIGSISLDSQSNVWVTIVVAVLGSASWYAAMRAFTRVSDPGEGQQVTGDRGTIYSVVAPFLAGISVCIALAIPTVRSQLGGVMAPSVRGWLMIGAAGVAAGLYYRSIPNALQEKYGGLGVFGVMYYVPLLGLTAAIALISGDGTLTKFTWLGLVLGMCAIALIKWPARRGQSADVTQRAGRLEQFRAFGAAVLTSLAWIWLQRVALRTPTTYRVSPALFSATVPIIAACVVFFSESDRAGLAREIAHAFVPLRHRAQLLGGGIMLGVMYLAIAILLTADFAHVMAFYYVAMVGTLAVVGRALFDERLALRQWIGVCLALVATFVLSYRK